MKEYLATPPTFKAQRWDGSVESAGEIIQALREHTRRCEPSFTVSWDGPTPYSEIVFNFREEYVKYDMPRRMRPEQWIVLGESGFLDVLRDDEFKAYYQPKE